MRYAHTTALICFSVIHTRLEADTHTITRWRTYKYMCCAPAAHVHEFAAVLGLR